MPERTYYQVINCLALRGCINTAKQLIQDKVNRNNIDEVLSIFTEFCSPHRKEDNVLVYQEIKKMLEDIKQKF